MKYCYFFSLFILFASPNSYSQCFFDSEPSNPLDTFHTRNNSVIQTIIKCPWNESDTAYYHTSTFNAYPNVIITGPMTSSFNCHAFAFHLSEGNTKERWLNALARPFNAANLSMYWTDGSFIEVCNESEADKVYYSNGDHSAITTGTSGIYESKWGANFQAIHGKNYCPYDTTNKRYFASTKISGSIDPLCSGTRTFSVKSISGATYTWARTGNLSFVGDSTLSSVTIQRSDTSNGIAELSVVITSPCHTGSTTSVIKFTAGKPGIEMITPIQQYFTSGDENEVCIEAENYFDFIPSPSTTSINWTQISAVPGGLSWTNYDGDKGLYLYMWKNPQKVVLRMTPSNTCGALDYDFSFITIDCSGFRMMMYPNPTSDEVTVQTFDTDFIKEIRLTDRSGNLKKKVVYTDKKMQKGKINISALPTDTYIVNVFNGKRWVTKQLIKK